MKHSGLVFLINYITITLLRKKVKVKVMESGISFHCCRICRRRFCSKGAEIFEIF